VHSMCLCTCVVFTYVCVRMYDDNIKAAIIHVCVFSDVRMDVRVFIRLYV
jgi:hypothetical protein